VGSITRDVPRSRWEADRVLRVLAEWPDAPRVAGIDDVRPRAILLELRDVAAERPHLLEGKLRALREHDAAHGTPYVSTLRAYLDALGDVLAAAKRLGVHPNTFRYRLRRLVEVSGIDLDDPDERAVTELQFRLSE
jgi:DNA-binding PucR family transcriptional regulator